MFLNENLGHLTLIAEKQHLNYLAVGSISLHTVNVVIFAGGKFRENVGKTFHVGVIFTIFHIYP